MTVVMAAECKTCRFWCPSFLCVLDHARFEHLDQIVDILGRAREIPDDACDNDSYRCPCGRVVAFIRPPEDDHETGSQDHALEHEPWDVWLRRRGVP